MTHFPQETTFDNDELSTKEENHSGSNVNEDGSWDKETMSHLGKSLVVIRIILYCWK